MDISQFAADQLRDTIGDKASTEFLMVSATSPQYNHVEAVINACSDSAWAHLGGQLPNEDPIPAGVAPTPPQQGLSVAANFQQIAEIIAQSSRSTRPKENFKTAIDTPTTVTRFSLRDDSHPARNWETASQQLSRESSTPHSPRLSKMRLYQMHYANYKNFLEGVRC
jgi:hypothetical protein